MIYFIEGPTCAGKSTLAAKLMAQTEISIAPEHTPPPLSETPSITQRQDRLFADFVSQFADMIASGRDYIADFSPLGVIPFCRAYADFLEEQGDSETPENLRKLANKQHRFMMIFKETFGDYMHFHKYLSIDEEGIKARLKNRNRNGDDCWNPEFLNLLVKEYDKYFAELEWKPIEAERLA